MNDLGFTLRIIGVLVLMLAVLVGCQLFLRGKLADECRESGGTVVSGPYPGCIENGEQR